MQLKTHHKWIIGSFSTLLVMYMIINSVFVYTLFVKLNTDYNSLNKTIKDLQTNTQTKLNDITSNIIETKNSISSLNASLKTEIDQLKASASSDFSSVIENSINSVVTIRTDMAQGTGFIITENGYVVTNAHVLEGGSRVSVITSDQRILTTSLVGYDSDYDIALLKISGNYNKLNLADSNKVNVGQKVIVIGNPYGLQFSVSEGIVSGINREGINGKDIYIQTDAALNPGNSGGPLINTQGGVIGITNFKVSGAENLGFALESNYIKQVVNDIANQELKETLL